MFEKGKQVVSGNSNSVKTPDRRAEPDWTIALEFDRNHTRITDTIEPPARLTVEDANGAEPCSPGWWWRSALESEPDGAYEVWRPELVFVNIHDPDALLRTQYGPVSEDTLVWGGRCSRVDTLELAELRELVRAAQHHIPRNWPQWAEWGGAAWRVLGPDLASRGSGDYCPPTT